jgi:HEAT repeat protein
LLPPSATAQPATSAAPTSGPVAKLREALENYSLPPEKQKAAVEEQAKAVRGAGDLSRALLLESWPGDAAPFGVKPTQEAQAVIKVRADIAGRFEEALRGALKGGDPARQCAAATLLADLPLNARRGPVAAPDPLVAAAVGKLLPEVARLSESKDAAVREAAARALGRIALDPRQTVLALGPFLDDREPAVRRAAAEGLARQARGSKPPPGEIDLSSVPATERVAAWTSVLALAGQGLRSDDEAVRRPCADAVQAAAAGLGDTVRRLGESREMRAGPGGQRGDLPEQEWRPLLLVAHALTVAVPSLVPLLDEKDAATAVRACQALEAAAAADGQLLRLAAAVPALGKAYPPGKDPLLVGLRKALPALTALVGHKDAEVRLAALYALEELGPGAAPAAAATAKAIAEADPFVRWAAARVLGKMAPAEAKTAVPALAARVADENGDVRITVLAALERYGPAAAPEVGRVSQVLKGGDESTRLWAVRVLAAAGPEGRKDATGPLIGALSAKEPAVRRAAAGALARYGKPDEATTAALRTALKDDDGEVRRTASEALLSE